MKKLALPLMISSALLSGYCVAGQSKTTTITSIKDTTVRADLDLRNNDNHGAQTNMLVGGNRGGWVDNDAIRSLLQFDLSSVKGNITKATLQLDVDYIHEPGTPKFDITAHKILQGPWTEGNGTEEVPAITPNAVWPDQAEGVAWYGASDGGDDNNQTQPTFDLRTSCHIPVDPVVVRKGDTVSCDLTELAKSWQEKPYENFGVLLRDTSLTEFTEIYFASREVVYRTTQDQQGLKPPRLVIETAEDEPATDKKWVDVNEKANGSSKKVKAGQTLRITLPDNGSTGYQWTVERYNARVLAAPTIQYDYPKTKAVGAGGKIILAFPVAGKGSSDIVLKKWRPWGGEKSVVSRFRIQLNATANTTK